MSEVDDYLAGLTEDALLVHRVWDHATVATFQPCAETVKQAGFPLDDGLERFQRPLAQFDSAAQTITIWPTKTRPSTGFLRPKYYGVDEITVEVDGLEEPEADDEASEILDAFLPHGFLKDWRSGLGLHKIYKPMIDAISQIRDPEERMLTPRSLRISSTQPTEIRGRRYILNYEDYDRLRATLFSVQARHQRDGLSERTVLAFNALLSDHQPDIYPVKRMPYRTENLLRVVQTIQGARLSPKDRSALLSETGRRAPEVAAASPIELEALRATLDLAALDQVIEKFGMLLEKKTSSEREWQALLARHPFVLGMVFGHPTVLVGAQAAIGGMRLDGKGERYVDFLLRTEATNSAAIVEIKRADTQLVRDADYAGVPIIHSELLSGVMQILDQKVGLLTNLHAKRGVTGEMIEGWHVSCVVIAGCRPTTVLKRKAFELYRNSLRDVVVLTYDELLSRLESLRDFLASPSDGSDPPAREPLL